MSEVPGVWGTWIGRRWTEVLSECVERVAAFRAAHPEQTIIDVQYADLVRDPVATVSSIHDAAGQSLDQAAASAMSAYITANPKDKHGRQSAWERFSGEE